MNPRLSHAQVLLVTLYLLQASAIAWCQAASPAGKSLPFELYSNQVYVEARVNGSRPMWFILDSGASGCPLDLARARAMRLKMPQTRQGTGAGSGTVSVAQVEGATVRLMGVD